MRSWLSWPVKAEWGVGSKLLTDFFVNEESAVKLEQFGPVQCLQRTPLADTEPSRQ